MTNVEMFCMWIGLFCIVAGLLIFYLPRLSDKKEKLNKIGVSVFVIGSVFCIVSLVMFI